MRLVIYNTRMRLAFTAILLALLLAACAAPAATLPSPTSSQTASPPTLTPSETPRPARNDPTASPSPPGENSLPKVREPIWVANETDGNLLLIDPQDNSIAVIIPTNLSPRMVTIGEGALWALDNQNDVLIQVDPSTYAILRVIPFPEKDVDALAVGAGYVWVAVTERAGPLYLLPGEEYTPEGGVLRLDPATGEIKGYAKTDPVLALAVQPTPAFLWILAHRAVDTPLMRLDPQSLAFEVLPLSGTRDWPLDEAFALAGNTLWLYSPAFGKLYRAGLDGRLVTEISLAQKKPLAPPALLTALGDLWLAAPWPAVLRIDPGRRVVVAEIPLDSPAVELVFASGSLWAVSPLGGSVYRIDPETNSVAAAILTGPAVRPTPRISPTPIQRAHKPCEDAPFSRLQPGMRAVTPREPALPNRVRKEPGKDADLSGFILPGQSVVLLEGPECKEGWVWWKIRNEVNQVEGWVAEGDDLEYWLIPLK